MRERNRQQAQRESEGRDRRLVTRLVAYPVTQPQQTRPVHLNARMCIGYLTARQRHSMRHFRTHTADRHHVGTRRRPARRRQHVLAGDHTVGARACQLVEVDVQLRGQLSYRRLRARTCRRRSCAPPAVVHLVVGAVSDKNRSALHPVEAAGFASVDAAASVSIRTSTAPTFSVSPSTAAELGDQSGVRTRDLDLGLVGLDVHSVWFSSTVSPTATLQLVIVASSSPSPRSGTRKSRTLARSCAAVQRPLDAVQEPVDAG